MPFLWTTIFFNGNAIPPFLTPRTREIYVTLNIGCVLIFIGVCIEIEKGMSPAAKTYRIFRKISEIQKSNNTDSFLAEAAYFH